MAKLADAKIRRARLQAAVRKRFIALEKKLAGEMQKRIEAIPQGEFEAAEEKTRGQGDKVTR
jgi:hypothetical protein